MLLARSMFLLSDVQNQLHCGERERETDRDRDRQTETETDRDRDGTGKKCCAETHRDRGREGGEGRGGEVIGGRHKNQVTTDPPDPYKTSIPC